MKNKNFFTLFFLVINLCFGQFIYTGSQQAENWLTTNNNEINSNIDSANFRQIYLSKKKISNKKVHHLGVFLNLYNSTNSKIIQDKSNLIGNGILTNYHFKIPDLEIVNSMFFSNRMQESKKGFVRSIKGISMYTNQAYLNYINKLSIIDYSLKIGRDFLIEGYGMGSRLFFSDNSRPFDQISMQAEYRNLIGKFAVINLDAIGDFKRYLYMHSFNFNFNKLSISFGEAVLSTGIEESIDLKYINPFNFWSWENIGSLSKGLNAFIYSGFDFRFKKSFRIYSEILLDDINFHNKDAYYLNRYAYLFGFQKTSFPFSSSNLWIEHSNVLNQVYQSYHPSHIFTHMGYPIGHHLGNDFISTRFHYSQIFKLLTSKIFFDFLILNQGVNNLNTPFDNPWEDNNGNKVIGYIHPGFPTPPTVKTFFINFGFELNLKNLTSLTIYLETQKNPNQSINSEIRISFWSYLNIVE